LVMQFKFKITARAFYAVEILNRYNKYLNTKEHIKLINAF